MFLDVLRRRNPQLIEQAIALHQAGKLPANAYVIDLDSVEYQVDDLGTKVRAALTERTGVPTIPQIFVGRTLVGGAMDTFEAFAKGRLQNLLASSRVAFEDKVGDKLYSLLPGWVQR